MSANESPRRADLERGLLCTGWLIFLLIMPHALKGDGIYRFRSIARLVEHGDWSPDKFVLIGSLPSIPLYLLGRWWQSPEFWVARYNTIVFGLGALAFARLLRGRVPGHLVRRFLLLCMTASLLPHELITYGAETWNATLVMVGAAAWCSERRVLASVLLSLGVANMPATLIGLAFAMAWSFWNDKRISAAGPLILAFLLWTAENWLRRGGPFATGYESDAGFQTLLLPYSGRPGFSYPLFFGLLSLLFSFGKGLLFFAPGLFLPLGRARQAIAPLVVTILRHWTFYVAGLLLVYARWWAWYGGLAFGPRLVLFATIPACLVLAVKLEDLDEPLMRKLLLLAALCLSFWVGLAGVTFDLLGQAPCVANNYALEAFCWYVPEFSVLWTPFVQPRGFAMHEWILAGFFAAVFLTVATPLVRAVAIDLWRTTGAALTDFKGRGPFRV